MTMALPLYKLLDITLCAQRVSLLGGDPHDGVLLPFNGELKLCLESIPDELAAAHEAERDEEGCITVGTVEATIIDQGAMLNRGADPFDVFESYSQDMHELYCDLFKGDTGSFKPAVEALTDGMFVSRLLYVESLFVRPEFRGHQLGLAAVYALMHSAAANCDMAALYASPFWQDGEGRTLEPKEVRKGQAALAKMYESIGFQKVRGAKALMLANLQYIQQPFPRATS